MECNIISTAVQPSFARINVKTINKLQFTITASNGRRLSPILMGKRPVRYERWRVFCEPVSLEEEFSAIQSKTFSTDEVSDTDNIKTSEEAPILPSSEELKSLLADSERSRLVKKLSEANQHNRFLKRQLQDKDYELVNFKSELVIIEHEIKALVNLAKEIAKNIPGGSRKIGGKYIHSHLLSRLEVVLEKLEENVKDVDAAQLKEVLLVWQGMAESVKVMGSFDGWTRGEHLSPEYTSSYTTFLTTLMLRRGRYEIKFMVDGEWKLSPQFPIVGEGSMQNNVLIVE